MGGAEMKWQDFTSSELDQLDRRLPVVMNVAAIEQHGPHLPLSTDAVIGQHFLDTVENLIGGQILTLPQMQVGCSAHHLDFAGTLSISHDTFLSHASDVLTCVAEAGFCNLVVLNSHGGNQGVGQVLVETLGRKLRSSNVVLATWWRLVASELAALNESGPLGVGHACEFETSLMLHIDPRTVRQPIPQGEHFAPSFEWADGGMLRPPKASLFRTMKEMSLGSGVVGTPSAASAAKGAAISEIVCRALVALLLSLRESKAEPSNGPLGPPLGG
jgi:creatinine amidohydrolase